MLSLSYGGTTSHAALYTLGGNLVFFIEQGNNPSGIDGIHTNVESRTDLLGEPGWEWGLPSIGPGDIGGVTSFHTTLPLWAPFVLLAGSTGWLWYRGERHLAGSCPRCGYDVSGIASSACPECGLIADAQGKGGRGID